MYFVFVEGGGGGGRKSGARKGQFAKSKGHHGRAGQNENAAENAGSILNMDPEYRTHMLFPGRVFINKIYTHTVRKSTIFL